MAVREDGAEVRELDDGVPCESQESCSCGASEFLALEIACELLALGIACELLALGGDVVRSGLDRAPVLTFTFDLGRPSSSFAIGGGPLIGFPARVLGASRSTSGLRAVVEGEECEEWEVPGRRGRTNDDNGASSSESDSADSDVSLPALWVRGRGVALGVEAASKNEMHVVVIITSSSTNTHCLQVVNLLRVQYSRVSLSQ